MLPIVSFIGHHNAGKTRLLIRLIETLSERGLRAGAVKHSPHLDIADPVGTDSQRLREAGAERLLLLGEATAVLSWPTPSLERLELEIPRLFADCDLVLVEGLKRGPFPKIEVYRRTGKVPHEPLAGEIDVLAVVSDAAIALPDGTRKFSPRDCAGIADFLETQFQL